MRAVAMSGARRIGPAWNERRWSAASAATCSTKAGSLTFGGSRTGEAHPLGGGAQRRLPAIGAVVVVVDDHGRDLVPGARERLERGDREAVRPMTTTRRLIGSPRRRVRGRPRARRRRHGRRARPARCGDGAAARRSANGRRRRQRRTARNGRAKRTQTIAAIQPLTVSIATSVSIGSRPGTNDWWTSSKIAYIATSTTVHQIRYRTPETSMAIALRKPSALKTATWPSFAMPKLMWPSPLSRPGQARESEDHAHPDDDGDPRKQRANAGGTACSGRHLGTEYRD